MLTWYNPLFGKIHTSLTTIEGPDEEETKLWNKKAPLLFKNVFAVMGDRKAVEVDGLAHELIVECLAIPVMRDEVYCQLMKQLTQNPSPQSEFRGWNLMAMCCASFPPSKELENYLEFFLRKSTRSECVHKLHMSILGGPLVEAPSLDIITRLRQGASNGETSFWMPGLRTIISFEEHHFTNAEKVEQVVQDWRAVQYVDNMEWAEKRSSKKRNSGGFMIHIGGTAPKAGNQGLSRVPSFMAGTINLGSTQSQKSFSNKSNGVPPAPSASPSKPVAAGSSRGPPPRPGGGGPPAKPPPKQAAPPPQEIDEPIEPYEDDDAPAPPPKPAKMTMPKPQAEGGARAPAAAPQRPGSAPAPPPNKPGVAAAPRPGGGPPPRPGGASGGPPPRPGGASTGGPPARPAKPSTSPPSPPYQREDSADVL